MKNDGRKTIFTTVSIDRETGALVNKICKRYSLKKGEVVKLAFLYLDKAHINPADAPESVKSELAKINKRQDDVIRFIRNYEEAEIGPMVRAVHSIAVRFDGIARALETAVLSQVNENQKSHNAILERIGNKLTEHAGVINEQGRQIAAVLQLHKKDSRKLLTVLGLCAELSACGVMDGKRKESLRAEIAQLTDEKQQ